MPTTITQTVYTIDELTGSAKDRARAQAREWATDYDWWEFILDDFATIATALGFTIKENVRGVNAKNPNATISERAIYFSGFSSQGDGACFEGTWRAENMKIRDFKQHVGESDAELYRIANRLQAFKRAHRYFRATLTHHGHYSHEYCVRFECDDYNRSGTVDRLTEESEKEFTELARSLMKWLYRQLEKEHEYRTADEQVDEDCRANEWHFYDDGSFARG